MAAPAEWYLRAPPSLDEEIDALQSYVRRLLAIVHPDGNYCAKCDAVRRAYGLDRDIASTTP